MHQIIMWVFEKLKDLEKLLRLIVIFYIMMLAIYWFQNLLGAQWAWLNFMKPSLDWILDTADRMYSYSFDFWGKAIEVKYFVATIALLVLAFSLKFINVIVELLQSIYEDIHAAVKRANERAFNHSLKSNVDNKEKQVSKFSIYIQTKSSNKYAKDTSVEAQDSIMNKFIFEKTGVQAVKMWDGYVYNFNNIERLDSILEVLFKIKNSEAPVHYVICIQVDSNPKQLRKLAELQAWGSIIIAADTLYRYNLNREHKYSTTSYGLFQNENGTLEVHEIVEEL